MTACEPHRGRFAQRRPELAKRADTRSRRPGAQHRGVPVLALQQLGTCSFLTTANNLRLIGMRLDLASMISTMLEPMEQLSPDGC